MCNVKTYAFYLLNIDIDIAIFCKYRIDIVSKLKYKLLCPRGRDTNLRAGRGQHRPCRILARCRKTPYPARLTEMEK